MTPTRQELEIDRPAYLADHRLPDLGGGAQCVLPATEALQVLAAACLGASPGVDTSVCSHAKFLRFLSTAQPAHVQIELEDRAEGCVARLMSRRPAGRSGLSRMMEHMRVQFGEMPGALGEEKDFDGLDACGLPGVGLHLDAARAYADLVPFGPAFHNLTAEIHLSPAGAFSAIRVPDFSAPTEPLGSPFALDAAFHLACVWVQHVHGVLTFPVGFAGRRVFRPIAPGQTVFCRIWPKGQGAEGHCFDLCLLDDLGRTCEIVSALMMQDLFSGKVSVPEWVRKGRHGQEKLDRFFRAADLRAVVLPLDAVAPYAENLALTDSERSRLTSMGSKRSRSFVGARLALKALARAHGVRGRASRLETVAGDGLRPACPGFQHVAAAHDDRFAVAVGADGPVGVDIERKAESAKRTARLWLDEEERALLDASAQDGDGAWLRAWCAKEAAAKALDLDSLAAVFGRARIVGTDPEGVDLRLDGREVRAPCIEFEGSTLCVLKLTN
ncbi:MAG: polyketide synthase dehydratase domain-containing protein [Deltaproteobacteria bacterium]|nr:polyketide synthase dehydratase domain-containing protein [Deltaproteobacteria bacterium]